MAGFGRMDLVSDVVQGLPAGVGGRAEGAVWRSLETQAFGDLQVIYFEFPITVDSGFF